MNKQNVTPIYDAIKRYIENRIVSFDVPGHKQGKGHKALVDALGSQCVSMDLNSSKALDNLTSPTTSIREAEELAAEAFNAKHAFFVLNGTTAAVQNMIFYCCTKGDKIILPRNVHKSVINALIITGAEPIYVTPGVNPELGISLGMSVKDVEKAIKENPTAKAVFVNNPTYYGVCSNLKEIVRVAHSAGMLVIVDEAHGTHFYFGEDLPISAMDAGADISAVSVHKTGGSLTQSSILLVNKKIDVEEMRQVINLTQTTSGSYLLMVSLDVARKNLFENGKEIFKKVRTLADYARMEINKIGGYKAFGKEIIDGDAAFAFDETKLSIHTRAMGLAGIEVYDLLRDEYGIQIEFGDIGNILAIISVGDRELEIERLLGALSEIYRRFRKEPMNMLEHEYIEPTLVTSPQRAFYAKKRSVLMTESAGKVSAELVMAYPPGIPILAPGELITEEIIEYVLYAKDKGCAMMGTKDATMKNIETLEE